MADIEYHPIAHDHDEFLKTARQRQGFNKAYEELAEEYSLVRELITARSKAGMTQEEVAQSMGTTKKDLDLAEVSLRMKGLLFVLDGLDEADVKEEDLPDVPAEVPPPTDDDLPF